MPKKRYFKAKDTEQWMAWALLDEDGLLYYQDDEIDGGKWLKEIDRYDKNWFEKEQIETGLYIEITEDEFLLGIL